MNWTLSKDQKVWEYRDAQGLMVASLQWEPARMTYLDREGRPLGNNFNAARGLAEKGAAVPEPASQLRMSL